ncbi:MAG: hypothetical protein Fur0037_28490 [Planctomycetota bacterium]
MTTPGEEFPHDPRSLDLEERRAWCARLAHAQRHWIRRLPGLVEPPPPESDFPAFLLATGAFEELRKGIGDATRRAELPTDVADELQWFVDSYRDYLRSVEPRAESEVR